MKKYQNIAVVKKRISKVICNGCGKELDCRTDYLSIDKTWGYGTAYDSERHCFDLCEDCYRKLIEGLKIAPEKK